MIDVADFESPGLIDADVLQQVVLREEAFSTPIYAALIGGAQLTATPEFSWQVDDVSGFRTLVDNAGAAYDANTTAIVVDATDGFAVGQLVLCEATRELLRVTAINSGTKTLTVVRSVGGIAAAAGSVANNAALRVVGYAAGEGSGTPTASQSLPTVVTNFIQTFRRSITVSGLAEATRLKTEMPRGYQRRKKFREIINEIERTLLFGQRSKDNADASGNRVWTTDGLYAAIATNVVNVGGNLTYTTLLSTLNRFTAYGSQNKIVFAGTTLIEYLTRLLADKVRVVRLADGVNLSATIVEAFGTRFSFIPHRGLADTFAADGICVDPSEATLRITGPGPKHEQGRGRLHLVEGVETPGVDGVVDEWFAELGLQYGNEKAHGRITGVTGVALT